MSRRESRAAGRMSKKAKILWFSLAVFLLLLLLAYRFYMNVQQDHWKAWDRAKATALRETDMVKAESAEDYIGNSAYTVVHGKDKDGKSMYVWVGKNKVYSKYASEGMDPDDLQKAFEKAVPDAEVLRITPGVTTVSDSVYEQYLWEVFYRNTAENRYYYDVFDFSDGEHLETYQLRKHY